MTAPIAPPSTCMRLAWRLPGIVDQRTDPGGDAVDAARALGIPVVAGMTIASTEGRGRVHSAKLANGSDIIPCDTILMSGGWTPSVHLFSQSRGPLGVRCGFRALSAVERRCRRLRRGLRSGVLPARRHGGGRQRAPVVRGRRHARDDAIRTTAADAAAPSWHSSISRTT